MQRDLNVEVTFFDAFREWALLDWPEREPLYRSGSKLFALAQFTELHPDRREFRNRIRKELEALGDGMMAIWDAAHEPGDP